MAYKRQWLADMLRRLGYHGAAEEALRDLPEEVELDKLKEFTDRHGISRDEIINRMGGSP